MHWKIQWFLYQTPGECDSGIRTFWMKMKNVGFCSIKGKSPAYGVLENVVLDFLEFSWSESNNTNVICQGGI
jgi:hypothetical protein